MKLQFVFNAASFAFFLCIVTAYNGYSMYGEDNAEEPATQKTDNQDTTKSSRRHELEKVLIALPPHSYDDVMKIESGTITDQPKKWEVKLNNDIEQVISKENGLDSINENILGSMFAAAFCGACGAINDCCLNVFTAAEIANPDCCILTRGSCFMCIPQHCAVLKMTSCGVGMSPCYPISIFYAGACVFYACLLASPCSHEDKYDKRNSKNNNAEDLKDIENFHTNCGYKIDRE